MKLIEICHQSMTIKGITNFNMLGKKSTTGGEDDVRI